MRIILPLLLLVNISLAAQGPNGLHGGRKQVHYEQHTARDTFSNQTGGQALKMAAGFLLPATNFLCPLISLACAAVDIVTMYLPCAVDTAAYAGCKYTEGNAGAQGAPEAHTREGHSRAHRDGWQQIGRREPKGPIFSSRERPPRCQRGRPATPAGQGPSASCLCRHRTSLLERR